MGSPMLADALLLFLVAAVGGIVMAVFIFTDHNPPLGLAILHAGLAATALILALWSTGTPGTPLLVDWGVIIVLVASVGGIFLTGYQLRDEAQPKVIVVIHALVAVTGVSCLTLGLLKAVGLQSTIRLFTRWFA